MRYVHLITGTLALALVAGLAAPPVCAVAPGDVNGDARTDVLDIQALAAAISEPESSMPRADVNRDGRVDVLDFQYVVSHASEQPADVPPPPAPERHTAWPASSVSPEPLTGRTKCDIAQESSHCPGKSLSTACTLHPVHPDGASPTQPDAPPPFHTPLRI